MLFRLLEGRILSEFKEDDFVLYSGQELKSQKGGDMVVGLPLEVGH